MKVYEKLGLPKLTKEQYACIDGFCPKEQGLIETCPGKLCVDCGYECLNADIPVKRVKRWETYNGDFNRAWSDYAANVKDFVVNQRLFANWLMEEIEVEA